MTGRDLIVYILKNGLEDELVYKNGKFLGFMTETEAAVKFQCGVSTIRVWFELGYLTGFKIGEIIHIPADSVSPMERSKPCLNLHQE